MRIRFSLKKMESLLLRIRRSEYLANQHDVPFQKGMAEGLRAAIWTFEKAIEEEVAKEKVQCDKCSGRGYVNESETQADIDWNERPDTKVCGKCSGDKVMSKKYRSLTQREIYGEIDITKLS